MTQYPPEKTYHFLVVDDDPGARETIVDYLKTLGHEKISQTGDGAEAIRLMDRDPTINFIISDWDMPLMNGLTLLQRVKAHPLRKHIPFMIITSPVSAEVEKVVLAAENMVDGYLIKPFRSQTFQQKLEAVLAMPVHGPQKQVMVVDDDPDSREMVIEYLKQLGFKDVIGIEDGKTAIDTLTHEPERVGLIIADWEMPIMNGIDLLRACKNHKILSTVPFLMITSQSSIERMKVMQAARESVDQYLLKPFTSVDIKKRIELLLEKARTRGEVQTHIAEAMNHLDHGRQQRALERFEAALKLDPENEICLRGTGDILMKTKGVEASLPYFKKALEVNPVNPKNYLRLAAAYEQIGWADKAIALMQSANQQIGFSAELHFHLGRLYNKKNLTAEAKAEFEKTLEIQLDHQEARLMLAMMLDTVKKGSS